jgi:hypothetical protein
MNNIHTLNYIGADDLVYTNDTKNNVYAGGFSINSILLKSGVSPIMTMNQPMYGGATDKEASVKVSDLFNNLVVPNWALSYNNRIGGRPYKEEEEDDVIDDDLHDNLVELVKQHNKILEKRRLHSKKRLPKKTNNKTKSKNKK